MNTPRRAHAVITLPNGIYAIGGFDGKNYLSSVEK
jgi:influenza virus NS1A-binding protein